MKDDFAERLRSLIAELGIEKQAFAKAGGISKQTLTGYLNEGRLPNQETLSLWVREFGLDGHWLLTGQGEMLRGEEKSAPQASASSAPSVGDPIAQRIETVERVLRKSGASNSEIREAVMTALRVGEAQQAEGPPGRKVGNSDG